MIAEFWVKIAAKKSASWSDRWDLDGVPKTSKNKPTCSPDEIPIKMRVEIPDSYFKDPTFSIKVGLPDRGDVDMEITPDLQDDIEDLIADELGVKVHLSVEKGPLEKAKEDF